MIKNYTEDDLVKMVNEDYGNSKNFQQSYFDKYLRFYKLYRNYLQDKAYPWRSNLFVPETFSAIETVLPRMTANKAKINLTPREISDEGNVEVNEQIIDWEWDEMEMQEVLKLWAKEMLMYGTGILKLTWNTENDLPKPEPIDIFKFYFDPNGTHINKDMRYVIQRGKENIYSLLANRYYKNIKPLIKELETSSESADSKQYKDSQLAIDSASKKKDKESVELLEWYGNIKGEPWCITIAAGSKVIKAIPNPYDHQQKPFVSIKDTQVPHEFYGIGEIEPIESLQNELNDIRNQRMDNVKLIINKMWEVDREGEVVEAELVWRPGGIVHRTKEGTVKPLEVTDIRQSAYIEETLIKQDIQKAIGVSDLFSALPQKGGGAGSQTATGMLTMAEQGNMRFKYKLDNIEAGLREVGKMLLSLNQQYMKKTKIIRLVGADSIKYKKISPKELKGSYDIIVKPGSTRPMNEIISRQEIQQTISLLGPLPTLVKHYIDTLGVPYASKILEELGMKQQMEQQMELQNSMGNVKGVPPQTPPMPLQGLGGGNALNKTIQSMPMQ